MIDKFDVNGDRKREEQRQFEQRSKSAEMEKLAARVAAEKIPQDVATHAALLVSNGWPCDDAIRESHQTLDDAELEGTP